uniref:ACT domain-containing protein n=1 Tax=Cryptomonas curvata TaxID=233186 RepID=A0A7S0QII8_9CRYP
MFCSAYIAAESSLSFDGRKRCPFLANGPAFISSLPLVQTARTKDLEGGCMLSRRCSVFPLHVKSTSCRSKFSLLCTSENSGSDENKDQPTGLEGLSAAEIEALPDLGSFMREGVETIEEIMAQDIRFGYKMRALQGEFSPPNGTSDSERSTALAETLMGFPGICAFRIVAKQPPGPAQPPVAPDLLACVAGVKGVAVLDHVVTERLGGKFVSLDITATVSDAAARQAVFDALAADPRVTMKF